MTANVGTIDRILRFIIGVVLIALPLSTTISLFAQPLFFYGAIIVGIVMLLVSVVRICPLYSIFGIKTCRV
ncbi:hypothetical protein PSE_2089 [Pseudovibrio sp. FO-BEG1]|uniref:Inner membrane protein YgaP-like transmembrane domain-containing protein n=2 Tax=Pseudovibrio TaxID=258255 RepID=A0A1I7DD80_9HYPH|nr:MULTISPECIES: DUF2892 domain-containing protein [Pseudovibrio]AEV36599.1 hypothetical protein PSE_2089 [Pseudovibrio sp. FO-BEG1]EEA94730.1 conserved hypothetical protein [Pseudovibrio sp. JE062]QUS58454.1 DUF2892 domain-containing protein [Pseudovibrio brasiliensis]SFU09565.1 Protein of unknown function [Pseudovibrio denitrificans]